MLPIIDIIKRLFPEGTDPTRGPGWNHPPSWAPDVFAAAATLISMSGCYAYQRYTSHGCPSCLFTNRYTQEVEAHARKWASGKTPTKVRQLWTSLLREGWRDILDYLPWSDMAMMLLSISDEASVGLGFVGSGKKPSVFANVVLYEHDQFAKYNKRANLPHIPYSHCLRVPPTEACVQPKTMTPNVGCTLRSLSHHLALLPPIGKIKTNWVFSVPLGRLTDEPLSLLLVPFPFRIDGRCFSVQSPVARGEHDVRFFDLNQNWLRRGRSKVPAKELSKFLSVLVTEGERDVGNVHGLVLPEAALDESQIDMIANDLARRTNLQLFVSGILKPGRSGSEFSQNLVYTCTFHKHKMLSAGLKQLKHHRWCLDRSQIQRYSLGHILDPRHRWWERIGLSPRTPRALRNKDPSRTCNFYVFREGASLATLICEDLARLDPVQEVLRSIGPNLVIVLLMDGPQLKDRWPSRYATVLADDPGSAVLTLTCLGMVSRSVRPGDPEPRQIALWKDPHGKVVELTLPPRAHGLLLTLSHDWEEIRTLDLRSDRETTLRLSLSGVHEVIHPGPPEWVDRYS